MVTDSAHPVFNTVEKTILLSLGIVAFILGIVGHLDYFAWQKMDATWSDLVYASLNLFFLQFEIMGKVPISLDIARWLAPATLSYALAKTLMSIAHSKLQLYKMKRLQGHAIIIGLDDRSVNIALAFNKSGIPTAIIDDAEQNQYWGKLKKDNVFPLVVNYLDTNLLMQVNAIDAKYLLACSPSDNTNLNIIYSLLQLKNRYPDSPRLNSVCQIQDRFLLNSLNKRALFAKNYQNLSTRAIGINSILARWLLNEFGPHQVVDNLCEVDRLTISIIGENEITPDLIMRLAEIGIYGFKEKLHVQLISAHASQIGAQLTSNHLALGDLISLETIDVDTFNEHKLEATMVKYRPNIVYVCTGETSEKLLALEYVTQSCSGIPIVVCETGNQVAFEWLQNEFSHNSHVRFVNINVALSGFDGVFANDLDRIAIAIHDNYLAQQMSLQQSTHHNTALVQWDELPEILKDANRNQADHIAIKCKYLTGNAFPSANEFTQALTPHNKEVLARMEHQRWVAEKKLAGWKHTLGEKDAIKRLSPSLIGWEALSTEEQQKDVDAVNQIPALLELINQTRGILP